MSTDHALPVPATPPHRLVTSAARALARLRAERPKVHVLTNFVAMSVSANVLLAVGAVPSMTFRAAVIEVIAPC